MIQPGDRIGPYLLERRVGRSVARQTWTAARTGRFGGLRVLLDVLPVPDDDQPLLRLVEAMRAVEGHPNLIRLLDIDEIDGRVVVAREVIPGMTLEEWLDAHEGPIGEARALAILQGVVAGLQRLHRCRPAIVHGALRPEHILMRDETPVLTGYGLFADGEERRTSHISGTIFYRAPETYAADPTPRADLWSAGAILHRMLGAARPFGEPGSSLAEVTARVERAQRNPLPIAISAPTLAIIDRSLQRDSAARFETAGAMLRAIALAQQSAIPTGTVSILFTDIVGSTSLKARMGGRTQEERDREYRQTVKTPHDARVAAIVGRYDGRVIKDTGDGFLITFASAGRAVQCAAEIRCDLASAPIPTPDGPLRIRQGIATGYVEYRDGDYIGAAVDRAARLRDVAEPGQIVLSAETHLLASDALPLLDYIGRCEVNLKGIGRNSVYVSPDPKAESRRVNQRDGAGMVWLPPFRGALGGDDACPVALSAFYLYERPVTVRQFRRFAEETNRAFDWQESAPRWGWIDDHPMVKVTWSDAADYCAWAGGRLPTEAEWERAARGPQRESYPWGDAFDTERCVHSVPPAQATGTGPVGIRQSESLFDLIGNVWEWCADLYDAAFWQSPAAAPPRQDPCCDGQGMFRVVRGGSWCCRRPEQFQSTYRHFNPQDRANSDVGFRCVIPSPAP